MSPGRPWSNQITTVDHACALSGTVALPTQYNFSNWHCLVWDDGVVPAPIVACRVRILLGRSASDDASAPAAKDRKAG